MSNGNFSAAQSQAIKAWINGDATATAMVAAGNFGLVANRLNTAAAPQVLIWKSDIPVSVLLTAINWTEYLALAVASQNAFEVLTRGGIVDATSPNIRNGFSSIFTSLLAPNSLAALTAIAQRPATYLESLFVTSGVSALYNQSAVESDVHLALGI